MTAGIIETPRLTLRPLSKDDTDLLVDLDGDPEVMRYLTNGNPTSSDETARIIQESLSHRWLAFQRAEQEFVGWFGLPHSATMSTRSATASGSRHGVRASRPRAWALCSWWLLRSSARDECGRRRWR